VAVGILLHAARGNRASRFGVADGDEVYAAAPCKAAAADMTDQARFDYSRIPLGYYDEITREGNPIRRLWHLSKFERVIDYLPRRPGQRLLDIGCFAGTFLAMLDPDCFPEQLGVDILADQIAYAREHHGGPHRRFAHIRDLGDLAAIDERFDCITLIEVIEHLRADEIRIVLEQVARLLEPGGRLVLTTPNYASAWPVLELLINRFSDLSYEEQHITRFTYWNIVRRLGEIWPPFVERFRLETKTTTHFVTPFLAGISFERARWLSRAVRHSLWRVPIGNLVLAVFTTS
jgi:2-polyprenyl-3-methyl-5-hydroxy-6-metoxy-1,4-benzoquinol methylase